MNIKLHDYISLDLNLNEPLFTFHIKLCCFLSRCNKENCDIMKCTFDNYLHMKCNFKVSNRPKTEILFRIRDPLIPSGKPISDEAFDEIIEIFNKDVRDQITYLSNGILFEPFPTNMFSEFTLRKLKKEIQHYTSRHL